MSSKLGKYHRYPWMDVDGWGWIDKLQRTEVSMSVSDVSVSVSVSVSVRVSVRVNVRVNVSVKADMKAKAKAR